MSAPLRDAVAEKLRTINDTQTVRDLPYPAALNVLADAALETVAEALVESTAGTTDARKKTIVAGLAARIARGCL